MKKKLFKVKGAIVLAASVNLMQVALAVDINDIENNIVVLEEVKPIYPSRAYSRGIEGECEVMYSVDTSGAVFNVVIGQCESVFARASKKAILKWRYAPITLEEIPVSVDGFRHTFTYKID